jgi:hypothetical protein
MSDLTEFFFTAPPVVVRLLLLEITHPNFSTSYKVVQNAAVGTTISVTHEDATGPHVYTHFPMEIRTMGSSGSMDQELEVTLADLGEILPQELDNVREANGMQIKPTVIYREYSSADLLEPLFGPFTLFVNSIAFNKTGCIFTAKPVAFNRGRTGEVYDVGRFPMLRGFV